MLWPPENFLLFKSTTLIENCMKSFIRFHATITNYSWWNSCQKRQQPKKLILTFHYINQSHPLTRIGMPFSICIDWKTPEITDIYYLFFYGWKVPNFQNVFLKTLAIKRKRTVSTSEIYNLCHILKMIVKIKFH